MSVQGKGQPGSRPDSDDTAAADGVGADGVGAAGVGAAGVGAAGVGAAGADGDAPYAAALAALPGAGPAVLVRILADWTPEEAWRRVRDGRLTRPQPAFKVSDAQLGFEPAGSRHQPSPGGDSGPSSQTGSRAERLDDSWRRLARRIDPPEWWARYANSGIGVTWPGRPDYPSALVHDPQRPGVLFWRGALCHLSRPCVAIVGTRRATPDGKRVAFELGRDLAEAGICIVSGLALGIDGAAHAGALGGVDSAPRPGRTLAGPAGVAASGVDVPYPRRHAGLWEQVARSGVMLSETLPGRPAQAWRFPARNRIIAGLVSMVVVVESHAAGGSLITAEAAIARGIDVRVVPGSVHSSASAGSNQLLYDGPGPVRNAQDVLDGLGIFLSPRAGRSKPAWSTPPARRARSGRESSVPTAVGPTVTAPPAPAAAPVSVAPLMRAAAPVSVAPLMRAAAQSSAAPLVRAEAPVTAAPLVRAEAPVTAAPLVTGTDAEPSRTEMRRILEAVSWQPTTLSQVVDRSGLGVATASRVLDSLEAMGLVSRDGGWWCRRSQQ